MKMVKSLQELCSLVIHRNFEITSLNEILTVPCLDLLWESMVPFLKKSIDHFMSDYRTKKMKITRQTIESYLPKLKQFVLSVQEGHDGQRFTLIDENTNNPAIRKILHILCDDLRLCHYTEKMKMGDGIFFIVIVKPIGWRWIPQNELLNIKTSSNRRSRQVKYCDGCDTSSEAVDLLVSLYCPGIYCDACIEADDEMSAHKWESLEDIGWP
jgi:hypothetical protein